MLVVKVVGVEAVQMECQPQVPEGYVEAKR